MTLNDLLAGGNLFDAMRTVQPSNPMVDFIHNRTEEAQLILLSMHGERRVFKPMENKTLDELARIILLMYGNNWADFINMRLDENSLGNVREIAEEIKLDEKRATKRNDVDKVSAFNSDELIDDKGLTSDANDDLDSNRTRVLTEKNTDLNKRSELSSESLKVSTLEHVTRNIAETLTLPIY